MTSYLITGANRGIGLALTTLLAERGDTVIATARDPKPHQSFLRWPTAFPTGLIFSPLM